jgi:hypothetical protein
MTVADEQQPQPTELEKEISAHAGVLEQAEQQAIQIDARLRNVPGIERYLSEPRRYGVIRNPWSDNNHTATALVARADRELAVWLASKAGSTLPPVDYEALAAEQLREVQIAQLQAQTAAMRDQRMARQEAINHKVNHGYWSGALGRPV